MTQRKFGAAERAETRGLIARLRAYCEIVRESTPGPVDGSSLTSTVVRVWGTLDREAGGVPATDACRATLGELHRIARAVAEQVDTALQPEIEPFRPVVYDSRHQPGRYEIHLSALFRVAGSDRELVRQIRDRLKILGMAEGGWRAPHGPADRAS